MKKKKYVSVSIALINFQYLREYQPETFYE